MDRGACGQLWARLQPKHVYAFSALSTHDGVPDSLVLPWVSAETTTLLLQEVAQCHPKEFVLVVMGQPGRLAPRRAFRGDNKHAAAVPAAYDPELDPTAHPWVALREQCIANAFDDLQAVERVLTRGLRAHKGGPERPRPMAGSNRTFPNCRAHLV